MTVPNANMNVLGTVSDAQQLTVLSTKLLPLSMALALRSALGAALGDNFSTV